MKHILLLIGLLFIFIHPLRAQDEGKLEKTAPEYSSGTLIKPKVELFPIPATKYLYVDVSDDSLSVFSFELYNIIGTKLPVYAERMDGGIYRIDVTELYQGQYMLIIKDPKRPYQRTYKFTKKENQLE